MQPPVIMGVALIGCALLAQGCNSADASADRSRDAPWELVGVSADGRTLRLVYDTSGCWYGARGTPVADVTHRRVRISVRQTHPPADACPDISAMRPASVRLDRPVNGRRVEGAPRLGKRLGPRTRTRDGSNAVFAVVPRVTDLDAEDARRVLALQHFAVRAGKGRVVAQRPRPGRQIRMRGPGPVATVRLRVK